MTTLLQAKTPAAPKECKRRGCTNTAKAGSAYCTDVHDRWDNPRVDLAVNGVTR